MFNILTNISDYRARLNLVLTLQYSDETSQSSLSQTMFGWTAFWNIILIILLFPLILRAWIDFGTLFSQRSEKEDEFDQESEEGGDNNSDSHDFDEYEYEDSVIYDDSDNSGRQSVSPDSTGNVNDRGSGDLGLSAVSARSEKRISFPLPEDSCSLYYNFKSNSSVSNAEAWMDKGSKTNVQTRGCSSGGFGNKDVK